VDHGRALARARGLQLALLAARDRGARGGAGGGRGAAGGGGGGGGVAGAGGAAAMRVVWSCLDASNINISINNRKKDAGRLIVGLRHYSREKACAVKGRGEGMRGVHPPPCFSTPSST